MKLYQLQIRPGEGEPEGRDCDQWFTSLKAAKKRRQQLIDEDPYLENKDRLSDYEIFVYKTSNLLTRNQLILTILNRYGWWCEREMVVPPYYPPDKPEEDSNAG